MLGEETKQSILAMRNDLCVATSTGYEVRSKERQKALDEIASRLKELVATVQNLVQSQNTLVELDEVDRNATNEKILAAVNNTQMILGLELLTLEQVHAMFSGGDVATQPLENATSEQAQ